jgi:uncharacterized protein
MGKKIVLFLIKIYQEIFSLDHGFMGSLFPNTRYCKFSPTCSEYGYKVIQKYGAVKGGKLALKRIFKCNPWYKGNRYDPVP